MEEWKSRMEVEGQLKSPALALERENYILDQQPKSWKEGYIHILKVRLMGFDSGFDVYLQKDRGAKDRGLRDEGRETPPSVWRWWERSEVQSVLGRLPRVCHERQVEIRSLFHSRSASSIRLSHCRQPPYSDLAFLNDPLSCSHPLPHLHSRPTGSQHCKNMQERPPAQGPYASVLSVWTALLPDFWFSIPSGHYTLSATPPLPPYLKSQPPAHQYSLSCPRFIFPLEVITIKCTIYNIYFPSSGYPTG